jgi:BarA-like signal transduction histidine kinase
MNRQISPLVVQILTQPPTRVVYQRILKPYPQLQVSDFMAFSF